jgi:chromosome segregation ATPase
VEQINAIEQENEKFRLVASEFERIFYNLLKDKDDTEDKLKNEIIELTKERDHLQEDVIGVEKAFDDLHRRFEKLKTKVEEFKKVTN